MKTTLKLLALFIAIALPSAFAAEFIGVSLPSSLDPLHTFSAFVVVLSVLTLFADYAATDRRLARSRVAVAKPAKSHHPLAA